MVITGLVEPPLGRLDLDLYQRVRLGPDAASIDVNPTLVANEPHAMLDVAIAPLLWRLGHYGIELPKQAAPLLKYSERIFSRPAYIDAMTPSEKAMRK